ncbi:putative N-acetyltransferase YjcF [Lysinibacillus alkalisoli]|uniref:N-acetyltransferase YjcF n=1 Tax=Lysinibacillus alkalisoli TaxID=1911548 RepID=A0A917G301_9BACI|nr:GNAT family N-acetyltransferase [Lysinibacillus alkalisoli]GGG20111.1 putative N-acetyltransferase YjcF [Lysinibacillus alkalisoli]
MYTVKVAVTPQEKKDAFSIREKVFVKEQGVPLHLEIDEFDRDETVTHFVMYDEAQVIGAARMRTSEDGVAKIERVCVDSAYRGKNLGQLVMEQLEEHAKDLPYHTMKLNAQSYAVPFYEKLGFVVTSPEFLDAGIPHRAMEKTIQ